MKLEGFFYLEDPEDLENDLIEVNVHAEAEHPKEPGGIFVLSATTPRYIEEWMKKNKNYFCETHLLIVPRLDDDTIREAIEDLLPEISRLGFCVDEH